MRLLLLLGLISVMGCGTPRPLGVFNASPPPPFPRVLAPPPAASLPTGEEPDPPPPDVEEPPPPAPPPPAFLYARTDEELRVAYVDGLAALLNGAARVDQPRRVSPAEANAWLDVLGRMNPDAVAFVRRQLQPVLAEDALAAYVQTNSNPAGCARLGETLFLSVPEKHQGEARPYVGLIAQDTCGGGSLCLRCTTVGGRATANGRPKVCTPAPCGR